MGTKSPEPGSGIIPKPPAVASWQNRPMDSYQPMERPPATGRPASRGGTARSARRGSTESPTRESAAAASANPPPLPPPPAPPATKGPRPGPAAPEASRQKAPARCAANRAPAALPRCQPAPRPPHQRLDAARPSPPRPPRPGAGPRRAQPRLDSSKRQIAIGADILRQHRMADPAPRAPHPTQGLTLSRQITPVPAMAPQGSPLTLRIRATQLRNRTTVHLLSILLAAQTSNAYHGLLSEARRAPSPSAKTKGVPGGLRLP